MRALPSAAAEFAKANLGDRRLDRRLSVIVDRVAASPSASFPKLVPSVAEREALYRFVENDRVDWHAILEPHHEATAERCRSEGLVRIAHDTSWFSFVGSREGLGPISVGSRIRFPAQGFAGHFSLASSSDETRTVLGVLAVSTLVREDTPVAHNDEIRKAKHRESQLKPRDQKESMRWMDGIRSAESRLHPSVKCVHVMDQEADSFAIFADLIEEKRRFVIRGRLDRRLYPRKRGARVDDALAETTARVFRTVPVTARTPTRKRKARGEREATLMIRARTVTLSKPEYAQHATKKLTINVVHVFEPKPPKGEEAIEWVLYTTEPIASADDLTAIVDHYRARWVAEEFFKALKTGCAYEKRQLETYDALLRALALLVPMAWHLLAIRSVARRAANQPASVLLDSVQLDVLRALSPSSRLSRRATARDVMRAIADIGGHIPQNGEPGWLVLGRGYEDFAKAEVVWRAALAHAGK